MDLSQKSRNELKAFFTRNAVPTQRHFHDLIEAALNQRDDGITKSADAPLCIEAQPSAERPIVHLYDDFSAQTPNFVVSLLPGTVSGGATLGKGLGIGNGSGAVNAQLFIEESTGNVGIGTVEPDGQKLKVAGTMSVSGLLTAGAGISVLAGQTLTAGGAVTMKSGATVTGGVLNANAGLSVPSGQTLTASGSVILNAGATVTGGVLNANAGLSVLAGQTLTANGSAILNAGATVTGGVLNANAGLSVPTGQTLSASGTVNLNAGATVSGGVLNANGGLSVPSGQTLSASGPVTLNAGATVTGGTLNANAGLSVPANQTLSASGTVNLNAGATVTGGLLNANAGLTVLSGQTLTANGPVALKAGATVSGSALLAQSGATISGSALLAQNGATITGAALTVGASGANQSVTVYGSISASAGATVTGGALTVGASGANQNLTVYGPISASAGATITGGTLTVGASGANQSLTVYGPISASAGATVTGGAFTVGASGANQSITVYGPISASAGATITGGTLTVGTSTAAQNLNVYGSITANSGATVTGGALTVGSTSTAQSLTVYGAISASAGAAITGGALTVGTSSVNQSLTVYGSLSASAGATITGGALNVGTSSVAQNLNVYGALSASNGATITGSGLTVGTSSVAQPLTVYGATTLNNTVTLTGILSSSSAIKTSSELHIDIASYRGTRYSSTRRALAHGSNDALIVNYGGDYSSGVRMVGQMVMHGPTWQNDNNLFLRGTGDYNHGVGYFGSGRPFGGSAVDGPVLYGFRGGVLGTVNTAARGVEAALVFTGGASSGGYVQLSAGMTEDFSTGLTVEAWVYMSSLSYSFARILDFSTGTSNNIILCQIGTSSSVRLHVVTTSGALFQIDAANVLSTGSWMHIAATIDTAGSAKIYKNGVAQTTTTTGTVGLPISATRSNCYLGKSAWSSDGYLGGKLAHVKMWSRALTADEIGDIVTTNRAVNTSNLVAWWPLDEGTGTSVRDKSGYGRSGTLTGTGIAFESYQYSALTWDSSNNVNVTGKLKTGNAKSTITKSDQQSLSTTNTWTDLEGMSLTVTTTSSNLLILFNVSGVQTTPNGSSHYRFQVLLDGSAVVGTADEQLNVGGQLRTVSCHHLKTGVTAGSHTIKVQWYTTVAGLNCCWSGYNAHRTLTVIEL